MTRSRAADRYGPARRTARRIVLISGDNTRTITVSPLVAGLAATAGALVTVGFLGATAYLMFRDDLIGTAFSRNAAMQQAYEDRIAALRSEIDRIASRQILDQVAFDEKVDRLLAAQRNLDDRQRVVSELIEKAKATGILADNATAADDHAGVGTGSSAAYASNERTEEIEQRFAALTDGPTALPRADFAAADPAADLVDADGKPDLKRVADQLAEIEAEQTETVRAIALAAETQADRVVGIVGRLGVKLRNPETAEAKGDPKADVGAIAMGGPYIPIDSAEALGAALYEAEAAFGKLSAVRKAVTRLPIAEPIEGAERTSNFGSRSDPFLGSAAFHAGIDFRSPTGRPVEATAGGTVSAAGRNGGYGLMVEVDHGNGLTTRYAHLSALKVKAGQKVEQGTIVGLVGSTGRSTGPHLHYETRVNGTAVNPVSYLRAGDEIERILD